MKSKIIQEIQNSIWVSKCYKNTFGIILPSGWLGRPFDNRHMINRIEFQDDIIKFVFDNIRILTIFKPSKYEIVYEKNYTILNFTMFSKIELEWIPYGEEGLSQVELRSIKFAEGKKLGLIGYFN